MSAPLWGFPWHGLLIGTQDQQRFRVGGAGGEEMPLSAPHFPAPLRDAMTYRYPYYFNDTVHVVRVPGIAPLQISAAEIAEQAAMGRSWQNYSLLHTNIPSYAGAWGVVNGLSIDGWVCIDPAGARWLVRPVGSPDIRSGVATIGEALHLRFEVVPFGLIGQSPSGPVEVGCVLDDIQQNGEVIGGEPLVKMSIASIASHGRMVLVSLSLEYPASAGAFAGIDDFPAGWLKLELTGNGPNFGVSLAVLHSREQCLGVVTEEGDTGIPTQVWTADIATTQGSEGLIGTLSGISASPASWSNFQESSRTGRLLSLVFDNGDHIVTMSADMVYRHEHIYGEAVLTSVFGELVEGDGESKIFYTQHQEETNRIYYEITVMRDGITVDKGRLERFTTGSIDIGGALQAPQGTTGDPPSFVVSVFGPSPLAYLPSTTWETNHTMAVNDAEIYRHVDSYDRSGGDTWAMHLWGVGARFQARTEGLYTRAIYQLRRHGNQLMQGSHSLYHEYDLTSFYKDHRFIASGAIWNNPTSATDPFSLYGCYNPATLELAVSEETAIFT